MTVVVGLDLSLTATGIAVGAGGPPTVTTVTSKGNKSDTLAQRVARLRQIKREVDAFLAPFLWVGMTPRDALIVIEGPTYATSTGHQHDRSGLWWLFADGYHRRFTVAEASPSARAKYATGVGAGKGASKDAVLLAVARRYPHVPVANNNEADALALYAMGARHTGRPIDDPLPATHLKAMDAVRWPDQEGTAA